MRLLLLCLLAVGTCWGRKKRFPTAMKKPMRADQAQYQWTEFYYETKVDHFSITDNRKFQMRYLANTVSYQSGGPLFFYVGNEGDIEGFATATGMMWDLAPLFGAGLIFAEHRFYGKTLPFGNQSYADVRYLSYLTSQQALADYAELLRYLCGGPGTISFPSDIKVIGFGGSYGGMLASWFKLKYPHLLVGVWASSAPVLFFKGGNVDYGAFDKVTTDTFAKGGCDNYVIANSWAAYARLAQRDTGLALLNAYFHINESYPITAETGVDNLIGYVREAIEYMAMTDYPYSAGFLTSMPGWPVELACQNYAKPESHIRTDEDIAKAMAGIAEVYYNGASDPNYRACIDPVHCGDEATAALGSPLGWPWQECSEIIIEMCARGGDNDFFWNECSTDPLNLMYQYCQYTFGSLGWENYMIDELAIPKEYGMTFLGATNMILTNGELDPWSAGGVKNTTLGSRKDRGVYAPLIKNSAHHLDLRQPNTCDPDNVVWIRYQAVQVMQCWLDETKCTDDLDIVDKETSTVPYGIACQDIIYGYPWGQSTSGLMLATPLLVIIAHLISHS